MYFLVGNFIAMGIGPTLLALITDYGFQDPQKLRYSMTVVCGLMVPISVLLMYLVLKPYRDSVARDGKY